MTVYMAVTVSFPRHKTDPRSHSRDEQVYLSDAALPQR